MDLFDTALQIQIVIIWTCCLLGLIFGALISKSFNFWKW